MISDRNTRAEVEMPPKSMILRALVADCIDLFVGCGAKVVSESQFEHYANCVRASGWTTTACASRLGVAENRREGFSSRPDQAAHSTTLAKVAPAVAGCPCVALQGASEKSGILNNETLNSREAVGTPL